MQLCSGPRCYPTHTLAVHTGLLVQLSGGAEDSCLCWRSCSGPWCRHGGQSQAAASLDPSAFRALCITILTGPGAEGLSTLISNDLLNCPPLHRAMGKAICSQWLLMYGNIYIGRCR